MGRHKKEVMTTTTAPETVNQVVVKDEQPKIRVKRNFDEVEMLAIPNEIIKKYGKDGDKVHYFWNKRDRLSMDKYKAWGYMLVEKDSANDSYKGIVEDNASDTSFIIRGDLVLMCCDIENWNDKKEHDMLTAKKQVEYIHENNKKATKAYGEMEEKEIKENIE